MNADISKTRLLFIRHAERYNVERLETQHEALLTEQGKEDAYRLGTVIGKCHEKAIVFHSPIKRCIQTAEYISRGIGAGGHCTIGGTVSLLGGDTIARNPEAVSDYFTRYGNIALIKRWFDGGFGDDIIIPHGDLARKEMKLIAGQMSAHTGLIIDVTHDWIIMVMLKYYLELGPEVTGIPEYLDGIAVVDEGSALSLHYGEYMVRIDKGDAGMKL
ncbi:MAG: histidine phosphatase family protein [Spirochaetales bacterium]|nr:histidine phosphatase family protein [Spirochaetales bacterium]